MQQDTTLDIQFSDDRDVGPVLHSDCGPEAGVDAWLENETVPIPHSTVWFDEAHAACKLWCELRGLTKPAAETFRSSVLAYGCEIDRQRSPPGSQKHYEYVIVHLRIGRSSFTGSTLEVFEAKRRRRAAAAKLTLTDARERHTLR